MALVALFAALVAVSPQPSPSSTASAQTPGCTTTSIKQWTSGTGANNHWYQLICPANAPSWTDARDAALALGGHLATITSANEREFVGQSQGVGFPDLTPSSCGCNFWLGGFQDPNQGADDAGWHWVTGENFAAFTNWGGGEPNDTPTAGEQNEENYLEVASENNWNDQDLTDILTLAYIVEWEITLEICKEALQETDETWDFYILEPGPPIGEEAEGLGDGDCEVFELPFEGHYEVTEEQSFPLVLLAIICTGTESWTPVGLTVELELQRGDSVTCTFVNGRRATDEPDEQCDFTGDFCPTPTPTPTATPGTASATATATPTPSGPNNVGGIFGGNIGGIGAGRALEQQAQATATAAQRAAAATTTIQPPRTGDGGLR
jgi:hypothetical protein